jgi:hypothetical protein
VRDTYPEIVKRYWYSIDWDVESLWLLDLPVETFPVADLSWHMGVPIWPDVAGNPYTVSPSQVLKNPENHAIEYSRIQRADASFPIEVFELADRLMILDGIHRLAQQISEGQDTIKGRLVPSTAVRQL